MSTEKRPVFAGNWKLFGTLAESVSLAKDVAKGVREVIGAADVVLAPGFVAISAVVQALDPTSAVAIAGQDCHWESKGAFTGEIAAAQLADAGCRYVILGHSERRQLMGETDTDVSRKTKAALSAALRPIVCVGETLAERQGEQTLKRIGAQLAADLAGLTSDDATRILIAYEPVWAIGTGLTATPEQAEEVHQFIRAQLLDRFPAEAQSIAILYGGSVKPDNIQALMAQNNVDGALVGGASLSAESFVRIVKEGTDVWSRS
jgi:triosephosphate isomerase